MRKVILAVLVAVMVCGLSPIVTQAKEPTFVSGDVATIHFKKVNKATKYIVYEQAWSEKGTKIITVRKKIIYKNEKRVFSVLRDDIVDGKLFTVKAYKGKKKVGKTQFFDVYWIENGLLIF